MLQARRYVDGGFSALRTVMSYDPMTMFAWRIAERDGDVIWSAGDGTSFTELQRAPIDVGMVRPRVLAYQGTDGSFTTTVDRANAGIAPLPACAAGTLRDTFDAELDPNVWSESRADGCQLAVVGGQLVLTGGSATAPIECLIGSGTVYDLYQGGIAVELVAEPTPNHTAHVVLETATEVAEFSVAIDPMLGPQLLASGSVAADTRYAQGDYEPLGPHAWVRFRAERGGSTEQLIWETSPDGVNYLPLAQTGDFVGLDRVRLQIRMDGDQNPPGALVVSGVNVP